MATDLEVYLDTVAHRRPARVLYSAGFTPDLENRLAAHIGAAESEYKYSAIARHYGLWTPVHLPTRRPEGLPKCDYSRYWEGQELPKGTTFNGFGVAMVPSGFYHFWGYISPLRNATSLKDIEDFPMDDMTGWDFSHMGEIAAKAHAEGKVVSTFCGHMYENAWQIRGYEQFLLDMIERPAWAECLLERLFQNNMAVSRGIARAGADILATGDDVANQNALMFSPDLWRKMILSRWSRIWQEAKSICPTIKTWYHTDGNVAAIIPEMIEGGLDILNPVQPECLDADAIHKRFGKRLCFDGCIGTQSTMPWGTPADVRARVREVIDKYGRDGGLFIAPTHVLEPEVPIANIEALFDESRRYGSA
ncbi:MAG: uroporphyrinogen decarboxylase family protein [Phycisphaerae bacterium]